MDFFKSPPNRRHVKNFLLQPRVQLRYAMYFMAFAVVAAVVSQTLVLTALRQILANIMRATNMDPLVFATQVSAPLRVAAFQMASLYALLALGCGMFGIYLTHRFVGPQVALRRTLEQLRRGNYEAECRLRPTDELGEVAELINALAVTLNERHGSVDFDADVEATVDAESADHVAA